MFQQLKNIYNKSFFPTSMLSYFIKKGQNYNFKKKFKKNAKPLADTRFSCRWEDRWPCLNDATETTAFDAHYIYHPAWAARKIIKNFGSGVGRARHIDISSSLHFVTMLSAYVPVDFYDFRPASLHLDGLRCFSADVTNLAFATNSIMSLSCMHVMEHIGLERYGDPFDPQGDLKGMNELARVLAPGGNLYFVVPVGREARIQYNAHRIYTYEQIVSHFYDKELTLTSFAFIDDAGQFTDVAQMYNTRDSAYGCGCFNFVK